MQLGILLLVAFIVSYIIQLFRQPIIIGYIVAGMIISPFILKIGVSQEFIGIFSELGIAFLLFIVGLHLNPKVIREVGKTSLIVGIAQMALTFGVAFLVSYFLLAYSLITSIYLGIAFSFSSTIIIMKLLSDKRQLDSLFGKLSIGILIIQDLVAAIVLMVISSSSGEGATLFGFFLKTLIGVGLVLFLFFFNSIFLKRVTRSIARSQELLFLFSICWCFIIGALFNYLGLSMEIGALVAGVVLSTSPYSTEISAKIRPLRDFFLILFFVILGLNAQISQVESVISNVILLSIVALIFKPIILMVLMALMGYTKRTNFLVGITLAQISEFSLIVLGMGVALGHVSSEVFSTVTLSGILTIAMSTYMIIYSQKLYQNFRRSLGFLQRKSVKITEKKLSKEYFAILFGYNRIGFSILQALKRLGKKYLVVDFNPEIIADLKRFRVPCVYGDMSDSDFLDELPLDKVKLIISTVPDFDSNLLLMENVRLVNKDAIIILRAHTIEDAMNLYKKGADYVLTPHFLGGEYLAKLVAQAKTDRKVYKKERASHIKMLEERSSRGQEHPEVEKD